MQLAVIIDHASGRMMVERGGEIRALRDRDHSPQAFHERSIEWRDVREILKRLADG